MYSVDKIHEIEIELSSHCNSKCSQCPRYDAYGFVNKNLNIGHLKIDVLKNLPFDKLVSLSKINLCGTYGDPLMHPELITVLDLFKTKKIIVSTNASLRNISFWHDLGKRKNLTVVFCLDGIGKTHEYYRRNTSYEKIIENAKSFIQNGGNAIWQFIIFAHNQDQTEQAKILSKKLGFKKIQFLHSTRFVNGRIWPVYEEGEFLYNLEAADTHVTLHDKLNCETGSKFWKKLYDKEKNKNIICKYAQLKKIYIHSDGSVTPCSWLSGAFARPVEKSILEKITKNINDINLNYKTFEEIISGKIYQEYFPKSLNSKPHPVCIETCSDNGILNHKETEYLNRI
jgi:MoaA/NifB/PqqE/SkfB family radical SAM enzyme